jgi:hypothetical protein
MLAASRQQLGPNPQPRANKIRHFSHFKRAETVTTKDQPKIEAAGNFAA